MTPPAADRWCCRVVEVAALVQPAEHRQRYALEFIAELYGMSRPQQVRHSVQVLSRAWALRAALDAAALAPIAITTAPRRPPSHSPGPGRANEVGRSGHGRLVGGCGGP